MPKSHIIIISSFVPVHNQSPVPVNQKMIRLCTELFAKVTFVTANFPTEVEMNFSPCKFFLVNLPVDFNMRSSIKTGLAYIKMQICAISALKKLIQGDTPVCFWLSGPMILPFLYCKLKQVKTVGFLYGNSKLKAGRCNVVNQCKALIMRFIANHADISCVESPNVLAQWGRSWYNSKFQIVHLYVDTDCFFEINPPERRPTIIGMCCRLVPNKRLLESIEAFHMFRLRHPDYVLEIVGAGPLESKCRKLIQCLDESNSIRLLGWLSPEQLAAKMNNWRLLLHPTNYEGLPNSLLESMCCATPVLSSPVGGVVDIIEDRKTGWFLTGYQAKDIASKLEEVLIRGNWAQVAEEANAFAQTHYCYKTALDSINRAFQIL